VVLEPDALLRPAVEAAVRRLGFEPGLAAAPVIFVNLGGLGVCPWLGSGPGPRPAGASVIGYVTSRPLTGVAHALHGCCAQVLELRPGPGGPVLAALVVPPALAATHPTAREADVLALLLAGATDRRAASLLGVAPSTVRSHARAVLRKVGVADRRQLRRLDVRPADAPAAGVPPPPLVAEAADACASGLRACAAEVRRESPRGPAPVAQG
jgi:DNA-binding CsgD family transcriptional regulator